MEECSDLTRVRSPTALGAHTMHLPVSLLPVLFSCLPPHTQVQWQGKGPEAATWLTRDDLVEMGLEKMVVDLDMKEAARAVSTVVEPLGGRGVGTIGTQHTGWCAVRDCVCHCPPFGRVLLLGPRLTSSRAPGRHVSVLLVLTCLSLSLCLPLLSTRPSSCCSPLQGLMLRPLTKANVEKHLGALGLEAEFATHAHIRGLSGGQKVKVVLAACTWNQPHILVMDEPTNYLDRCAAPTGLTD